MAEEKYKQITYMDMKKDEEVNSFWHMAIRC